MSFMFKHIGTTLEISFFTVRSHFCTFSLSVSNKPCMVASMYWWHRPAFILLLEISTQATPVHSHQTQVHKALTEFLLKVKQMET